MNWRNRKGEGFNSAKYIVINLGHFWYLLEIYELKMLEYHRLNCVTLVSHQCYVFIRKVGILLDILAKSLAVRDKEILLFKTPFGILSTVLVNFVQKVGTSKWNSERESMCEICSELLAS